ncbi:hypothetical protein [Herbiconiux ginsengi]|uniref:Htaa protein n=1 Tax=Herbiconiux ginsengi TaxID=381665 RepID=A0A1H3N0L1_9MICO|nr:hypothetical protein [Herbiconiux ginsengi]SDY82348.1 hypothetical protein SAMN05216554_1639 [Herbiconiux ginsengi]
MNRPTKMLAALGVAVAAVLGTAVAGPAAPAQAAGSVRVSVTGQPELVGVADPDYLTDVTVTGSGFQSIPSGFGGIYVFFGWVDGGAWAPSQGGATGSTYRYVYDDEANPVGYQVFVSFPGSSTEYAANGGEVSADGSWSASMKIPGASFESYDRNGDVTTVDCLAVQCGIITIGAHGVVNPSNESFTPISFQHLYSGDADAAAAAEAEKAAADAAAAAAAAAGSANTSLETDAPAPVSTTIIAAPTAASDDGNLVPILLGAVGGVGVLALAAIGFLVWAVLSSRRRAVLPAPAPAAAMAATDAGAGAGAGSPPASGIGGGVNARTAGGSGSSTGSGSGPGNGAGADSGRGA